MLWCASAWVLGIDLYGNTVVMIAVRHVEVSVVEICNLIPVADRGVSAGRTMNVVVLFMAFFAIHVTLLSCGG